MKHNLNFWPYLSTCCRRARGTSVCRFAKPRHLFGCRYLLLRSQRIAPLHRRWAEMIMAEPTIKKMFFYHASPGFLNFRTRDTHHPDSDLTWQATTTFMTRNGRRERCSSPSCLDQTRKMEKSFSSHVLLLTQMTLW